MIFQLWVGIIKNMNTLSSIKHDINKWLWFSSKEVKKSKPIEKHSFDNIQIYDLNKNLTKYIYLLQYFSIAECYRVEKQ